MIPSVTIVRNPTGQYSECSFVGGKGLNSQGEGGGGGGGGGVVGGGDKRRGGGGGKKFGDPPRGVCGVFVGWGGVWGCWGILWGNWCHVFN